MPNQGPLIYVVDADIAVRSSLEFSLEIEGFTTRAYADATSFLKEADFSGPSIVIVDFDLPDMTGLDVLDMLRKRGLTPAAILIASVATQALRKRAMALNTPVVEKPFSGDHLIDTVRAAFARE